jgi:hypothetical protein
MLEIGLAHPRVHKEEDTRVIPGLVASRICFAVAVASDLGS